MGAISGLCIGKLNNIKWYYKLKVWQECFIGMILVVLIEFIFGSIALKYGIRYWNYSNEWMNYKGIICLPYAIVWYFIVPFCMYVEDILDWRLFNIGEVYGILDNYIELFSGK
jgi:uncharacterized membrane protein